MTRPPFPTTGLHPDQIVALRENVGLSPAEFARWFGTSERLIAAWESEGLSTGPYAVAVRAVASAVDFEFPEIPGGGEDCILCGSPGYHQLASLPVCRSCYLTPVDSMTKIGFQIEQEEELSSGRLEIDVTAPPDWEVQLPLAEFGPEDWFTAVKKLRYDEPQIGHGLFDDEVFISSIDEETAGQLTDPALRELIVWLVRHGEVEFVGKRVEVKLLRRESNPPIEQIVQRCGLLLARLASPLEP